MLLPPQLEARRLLLNSLWPKRMVLQSDTAQPLVAAKKPDGRLQSEGYANHKGGEVMLSAERTSLPSRSLRAAASRGASDSRPR